MRIQKGEIFGRLFTVKPTLEREHGNVVWICQCLCDARNKIKVSTSSLRSGNTRSCGCLLIESRSALKGPRKDLTGKRFGSLTVVGAERSNRLIKWLCKCSCPSNRVIKLLARDLKKGKRSCGNCRTDKISHPIVGRVFGWLTIMGAEYSPKGTISKWQCKCVCGNVFSVRPYSVVRGATRSCGCLPKGRPNNKVLNQAAALLGDINASS